MQGSDGVGGAGVPCPIDEHVGDGLVLDLICLAAVPKEGAEDVCPLFGGDVFEVARGFVCSVDGAVGGEGDAFAGVASAVVLVIGKSSFPSEDEGDELLWIGHGGGVLLL